MRRHTDGTVRPTLIPPPEAIRARQVLPGDPSTASRPPQQPKPGAVFSQPTWIFPKAFQAEVMRKKPLCSQLMKLLGYEVRSMLFLSHRGAGSGRRAELGASSGRPRGAGLGRECTLLTWKLPVTNLPKAGAPLSFSDGSVSSSLWAYFSSYLDSGTSCKYRVVQMLALTVLERILTFTAVGCSLLLKPKFTMVKLCIRNSHT